MPKKKQDEKLEEQTNRNTVPEEQAASENTQANVETAAAFGMEIDETAHEVELSDFVKRMGLEVLYSGTNTRILFRTFNVSRPGLQLAGYYKHFSAERVQVIGEMEMAYLEQMTHDARKTACETLLKHPIPCLIVTSKTPPCDELLRAVTKYDRILLSSKLRTTMFVNNLSLYLNELLAPSQTVHGVLMDLYGVGVLVIGESGIGKSETALSLIERGHRLVADDAVTITRIGDKLNGTCPDVIRYFMEVRGIGIIDVKAMYGAGAVRLEKSIDMVVRLEAWDDKAQYNRMGGTEEYYTIFDIKVPLFTVPVKPGRNLAVILEAAARTHRLSDFGFNAVDELNDRIRGNIKKY